jgi:hypothetical protein
MSLAEKPHHTSAILDNDSKTQAAGAEKVPLDHGSAQSEENVGQMLTGPQFTAAQTKKLLRRCDKYLLPFLALLYLLSFLDRTNIGNAKLANLEVDLKMTGKWDYNVSSSGVNGLEV